MMLFFRSCALAGTVLVQVLYAQASFSGPAHVPPFVHDEFHGNHMRRRATASAAEIEKTKEILKNALGSTDIIDPFTAPRRNKYTLRPDLPVASNESLFFEPEEVRDARVLISESKAEELYQKGELYKEYKLAYMAEDGSIAYKTHRAPNSEAALQARQSSGFWMSQFGSRYPGNNPFGPDNAGYKVFRNVKDYGAKGDGRTDDTDAINKAITDGDRCGAECGGSSVKSATVYFPPGTYRVSKSIVALFHTQMVGDPNDVPIIHAASNFEDIPGSIGIISANVYYGRKKANGEDETWYLNQGNFFRQLRNFVIDMTEVENEEIKGVHWQVAQATSMQNVHFKMRKGSNQNGLFIENGSGGTLDDLTFEGGKIAMECGNQQYTVKNIFFEDCDTAISMLWDWGWIWKGVTVHNAKVGISFQTDEFPGGSLTLLDARFEDVGTGVIMDQKAVAEQDTAALILLNVNYRNTPTIVDARVTGTKLSGGSSGTVTSWFMGHTYEEAAGELKSEGFSKGQDGRMLGVEPDPPESLLFAAPSSAGYFTKSRPQYENGNKIFVTTAKGDGQSDDTAALSNDFKQSASSGRVLFIPAGSYIVTDTILIPRGAKVVGMSWSQIVASGQKFEDINNPKVMIKVGNKGDTGDVQLSDLLFTARGPTAGLIAMEWNLKADSKGSVGMWDCHFRLGGAAGTRLQLPDCPKQSGVNPKCIAGTMMLHLTKDSSAYLDNVWAWVADHDLDHLPSRSEEQIDIYVARGVLIESQGPTWLWGTGSEHSVLYQYALSGARNLFMGLAQTESAYFRPNPPTPEPFRDVDGDFNGDPQFGDCGEDGCSPWALRVEGSSDVTVVGAGFYSWFLNNYAQTCIEERTCQHAIVEIDETSTKISFYNLFTVGSTEILSPVSGTALMADDTQLLQSRSPWTSCVAAWVRSKNIPLVVKASVLNQGAHDYFNHTKFPDHCHGIDLCEEDVDDNDNDQSDEARAAAKGGYLCLLDAVIKEAQARIEATDDAEGKEHAWDKVFWRDATSSKTGTCSNIFSPTSCPGPEDKCGAYEDPAWYWLLTVMHNYNARANAMLDIIVLSDMITLLSNSSDVANKILEMHEEPMALKKILKIVSQVLGWIGVATPHLGGRRAETTTELVNIAGMGFDTAQEHLEEEEDDSQKLRDAIDKGLGAFMTTFIDNLAQALIDFYQKGDDLSSWPRHLFKTRNNITMENGEKYQLQTNHSKLLADQSFIDEPDGMDDLVYFHVFNDYTVISIILLALSADKPYYILKNPIHMPDCGSDRFPTSLEIDGDCYELHRPGNGWDGYTVNDPTAYSVGADDDVKEILDFTVSFHSDREQDQMKALEVLYRGSIACQEKLAKDGSKGYPTLLKDQTITDLRLEDHQDGTTLFESCLFNLPVLTVMPQEFQRPTISTPCIVNKDRSDISGAGGDDKLGINFLPEHLKAIFGKEDFCNTKCEGRKCQEEATACPRTVCLLTQPTPAATALLSVPQENTVAVMSAPTVTPAAMKLKNRFPGDIDV